MKQVLPIPSMILEMCLDLTLLLALNKEITINHCDLQSEIF
jgi:hypothetical protein